MALLLSATVIGTIARADEQPGSLDPVIVTGTRQSNLTIRQSPAPIQVISAAALAATGQTTLLDALRSVLPSLTTLAVGYDVGALARTFELRGLSPGDTLVLINGKRRHLSASLYADEDPGQGSNAVDLDLIPLSAVDHIEVLQDGAAAQYGSDAIAGVINIILKSGNEGFESSALAGGYYDGGGETGQVDAGGGLPVGADGSLYLSGGYRYHDFSNRSGESGGPQPAHVQGDPRSNLATFGFNLDKPVGDGATVYGFGTVAYRGADAFENPREPGETGVAAVDVLYPDGFSPLEQSSEADFGVTGGIKGQLAAQWSWDLSETYGRDLVELNNIHTVNPDLLTDYDNPQSDFHVGAFASSESTTNLDLRRPFDVGAFAGPLTVAFGVENRYERFQISPGEPNSYYGGGPQAFPGFMPSDAANVGRNSVAGYVDLATRVTSSWQVDLAGRAEHYNSVGSTQTGKLSTRYDFSPKVGVRATVSNGFHAPTLAQEYYSATTVTTGYAEIQVPLGTPAARVLGAPNLRPETSRNVSAGVVLEPVEDLHISVDAYQVDIDNRIVESGSIYGSIVADAIAANGSIIPNGVPSDGITAAFFTNGVNTRTRGVDVVADYLTDLAGRGTVKWSLEGNYNETSIRSINPAPEVLQEAGVPLLDPVQISNLTTATPHFRIAPEADYSSGPWDVRLRESFYSYSAQVQGYAPGPYFTYGVRPAYITDFSVGYRFNEHVNLTVGANNALNVYPNKEPPSIYQQLNYDQYSHISPYGIDGGFYYVRADIAF